MPSNKELSKQALVLATALSLKINTDDLNNEKLAALVSDLKAKKKDKDTVTQADTAEAKAAEAKKPPFYVKPGKALTSKRGILATERGAKIKDCVEIKASDLAGGQEALDAFVKSGYVGKA